MPTKKKMDLVEELTDRLNRCTITVATDHTGLAGNAMTELRQRMRERNVEYRVVKNTLAYLAAEAAHNPRIKDIVQGPTALAFGYEDPIEVARALEEYIRVNRSRLTIRGAVLDGRTLSSGDVITLTQLPPRDVLISLVLGQLQAPIAALLGQLQAPLSELASVLNGPLAALTSVLNQRAEQVRSQQGAGQAPPSLEEET